MRKRTILLVLMAFLVPMIAVAQTSDDVPYVVKTIRGEVVSPGSGSDGAYSPVAGATVAIVTYPGIIDSVFMEDGSIDPDTKIEIMESYYRAVTDESGQFVFENIKVGSYINIDVQKNGYYPASWNGETQKMSESIRIEMKKIEPPPALPEGVQMIVSAGQDAYSIGEHIDFTVTLTNTTDNDIDVNVIPYRPLKYALETTDSYRDPYPMRGYPNSEKHTIGAGESEVFNGTLYVSPVYYDNIKEEVSNVPIAEDGTAIEDIDVSVNSVYYPSNNQLTPGEHVLFAGIAGYSDWQSTQVTVSIVPKKLAISGIIRGYENDLIYLDDGINRDSIRIPDPLPEATITLRPDPHAWYYHAGDEWNEYTAAMPDIDAEPVTIISDENGEFVFENASCGAWYVIEAKKEGYFSESITVYVSSEKDNLQLMLRKIKIVPDLPQGLKLSVSTTKEEYALGETVEFTVTLANTTSNDIEVDMQPYRPIKCMVDYVDSLFEQYIDSSNTEPVTIPSGGTVSYDGTLNGPWRDDVFVQKYDEEGNVADLVERSAYYWYFTVSPGEHTINAGIVGYNNLVEKTFTVTENFLECPLSGTVITQSQDRSMSEPEPVSGVTVTLSTAEYIYMDGLTKRNWTAVTDADGSFSFENVPVGVSYYFYAEKEGYHPYRQYLTMYSQNTAMNVWLKPVVPVPSTPMVVECRRQNDMVFTFGADRSVYAPGDHFRAFYRVKNDRTEAVTFSFDHDVYVDWTVESAALDTIWCFDDVLDGFNNADFANGAEDGDAPMYELTIEPGEEREFTWEGSFDELSPDIDRKYTLTGRLDFRSSTIDDLTAENTSCGVVVLLTANYGYDYVIENSDDCVIDADFRDTLGAGVDCTMNKSIENGTIRMSRVENNVHGELSDHRYLAMFEVDADVEVRRELSNARIRIHYTTIGIPEDVDPENLVIGHWTDNPNWDESGESLEKSADSGGWQILDSTVDTVNGFIEAYTTDFSSFALFEAYPSTAVEENGLPGTFVLSQNSPNPFNPSTAIRFTLPEAGAVTVAVYNSAGQEIARLVNGVLPAGSHRVMFDGSRQASGIYFYRVYGASFDQTRKMLLMK